MKINLLKLTCLFSLVFTYNCTRDTPPASGATDRVVFTTRAVTNISADSAKSGADITSTGGYEITVKGICWDTLSNPDITKQFQTAGNGSGNYLTTMRNLLPNKRYYVRAYIKSNSNDLYGNVQTFITPRRAPKFITSVVNSITKTTAVSGGIFVNDGGATVTSKGICWSSTNPLPTTSGTYLQAGSGNSTFSTTMTGLTANTRYYVRAFATNGYFMGYSDSVRQFTTLAQ